MAIIQEKIKSFMNYFRNQRSQARLDNFKSDQNDNAWLRIIEICFIVCIILLVISSFRAPQSKLSLLVISILLAGASASVGGLIGFLFGIPRSLQGTMIPAPGSVAATGTQTISNLPAGSNYSANTNLEQISDWLTKILVGVGLTQLGAIWGGLQSLGDYFGPSLDDGIPSSGKSFAIVTIIFFSIIGFFYVYLWTRLILMRTMIKSDQNVTALLDKQKAQENVDARALAAVNDCLEGKIVEEKLLIDLVKDASPIVREAIFYKAEDFRHNNWRLNQKIMERCIPIFKSIINTDEKKVFWNARIKLAYVLKDKDNPDFAEAKLLLDEGILLRSAANAPTQPRNFFNRAFCKIMLDENFKQNPKLEAVDNIKNSIISDIDASIAFYKTINDDIVSEWLKVNKIDAGQRWGIGTT